jgi:preprotein translocase subunit SecA
MSLARPASRLPRPGPLDGPYPSRRAAPEPLWMGIADRLGGMLTRRGWEEGRKLARFLAALERTDTTEVDHLAGRAQGAAHQLAREGFTPDSVARAQRVAAHAIELALGQRPYRSQHIAAFHLLDERLVELDTGEGKSLAVLLAASTAALARVPTHVITANEYLAQRDADAARRVLTRLGLSVAVVRASMSTEERRAAYACDVVYATSQEIGFDYLRDCSASRPVMRGLCLALVDEADSVLLDQAQTPLVLAEACGDAISPQVAQAAWNFAGTLRTGLDFTVDTALRRVQVEAAALGRIPEALSYARPATRDPRVVAQLLQDALVARHALRRDVDYIVRDDAVVLVDLNTGRALEGTVWSRGLDRMVCIKEGLAPRATSRPAQQISLQGLLGRYLKLAGISGTLLESRLPLWCFYRMTVRRVDARLPARRRHLGVTLYRHGDAQRDAVAARVIRRVKQGRAVLVGTDSICAAEALSRHLHAHGVPHELLTARNARREADLVARAGLPGAVTVATHIAGRGTDIPVARETLHAGGLHVISCAQNGCARIERQLVGRSARNGEPGSCETVLSLDDGAFAAALPRWVVSALRRLTGRSGAMPRWLGRGVSRAVHTITTWNEVLRCWQRVQHDRLVRDSLVFAPRAE